LGPEILKLENVTSGYDPDLPVIRSISLELYEGSIVAVVGANGAGKSTLLKTIYGFLKPFTGKIFYQGRDITSSDPHEVKRMGIAYIPQDLSAFGDMTVEENLKMGLWLKRESIRERLEWAYELFPNLRKKRGLKASNLSGGEMKMLDIARGLMIKPKLLLIDEPSVGLSPIMAEEVYKAIQRINKEDGITVLLVDQNVKRAIELSDHAFYLENGEMKYSASSDKIALVVDKIIEASLMGDLIKIGE
jgi:branched-chain amino acid transport system ATP-binding protein